LIAATCVLSIALFAETKVKMESLPAAVYAAVKEQTKNATLVGLSKETEKGKTQYEVSTTVNGKSRDVTLDATGAVVEVEEEVELATVPLAAKVAIEKRAAGGSIRKVERLTAGASISYESAITTRAGKETEVGVNADGTPHKK
jgi:uncharacterized membrane protein YkoI